MKQLKQRIEEAASKYRNSYKARPSNVSKSFVAGAHFTLSELEPVIKEMGEALEFYGNANSANRVADGNLANNVLKRIKEMMGE